MDFIMAVTELDTHKYVKKLKAAGFTEAQAVAVVYTVRDAIVGDCITKPALNADIIGFKKALRDFERRLTIRVGAMMLIWALALVAALKIFS